MSLPPAALMEALYRAFAYPWNGIGETVEPLRAFATREESTRWSRLLEETLDRSGEFADRTAEQLAPLGQRAMKHIGALTTDLTDAGMGVQVTWRAHGGAVRRSNWTPSGALRVRYLCEESEFTDAERVTVSGWLGTASSFRGKVEIRTDSGEIIRASTDEELTGQLDVYFNRRVSAEVEVTKVVFAGGRERKLYSVLNIRKVDGAES